MLPAAAAVSKQAVVVLFLADFSENFPSILLLLLATQAPESRYHQMISTPYRQAAAAVVCPFFFLVFEVTAGVVLRCMYVCILDEGHVIEQRNLIDCMAGCRRRRNYVMEYIEKRKKRIQHS